MICVCVCAVCACVCVCVCRLCSPPLQNFPLCWPDTWAMLMGYICAAAWREKASKCKYAAPATPTMHSLCVTLSHRHSHLGRGIQETRLELDSNTVYHLHLPNDTGHTHTHTHTEATTPLQNRDPPARPHLASNTHPLSNVFGHTHTRARTHTHARAHTHTEAPTTTTITEL